MPQNSSEWVSFVDDCLKWQFVSSLLQMSTARQVVPLQLCTNGKIDPTITLLTNPLLPEFRCKLALVPYRLGLTVSWKGVACTTYMQWDRSQKACWIPLLVLAVLSTAGLVTYVTLAIQCLIPDLQLVAFHGWVIFGRQIKWAHLPPPCTPREGAGLLNVGSSSKNHLLPFFGNKVVPPPYWSKLLPNIAKMVSRSFLAIVHLVVHCMRNVCL